MNNSATNTTKRYFELSNQNDLTAIKKMIHPEATYSSVNTGLYYGIDDIMAMMENFFAQFAELNWHIDELKAITNHITEVAFTCCATDHLGGKSERSGIESLVVVNGLIRHIEVR